MEFIAFDDSKIVIRAANFIVNILEKKKALTDKPLVVGVSGGGSPRALYPVISDMISKDLSSRIILIQIDERIVAPSSNDSNQFLINNTLGFLIDNGATFYPMPTHAFDDTAGESYGQFLKELFKTAVPALALLGCGTDGHTASIFPDQTSILPKDDRLVFTTSKAINGYFRISLTYNAIFAMETAILYSPGYEKKEIVSKLLNSKNEDKYPAAKVMHNHKNAYLIGTR